MELKEAKEIVMAVAYGSSKYTREDYFKACGIYASYLIKKNKVKTL